MKRRVMLLIVLIIATGFLWQVRTYFLAHHNERRHAIERREALILLGTIKAAHLSDSIWAHIKQARTPQDWEHIIDQELALFGDEDVRMASILSHVKLFEARFWMAEWLLTGAGKLLAYDVHHPMIKKYKEQAKDLYAQNDAIAAKLQEQPGNSEWNAYLNYLKGVFYFRSLLFVKEPAKEQSLVEDLVTQSFLHFKKVFVWLPKDNDTQIAIELLQKKSAEILASQSSDDALRLQLRMLPSRNIGPEFFIDGRGSGKH